MAKEPYRIKFYYQDKIMKEIEISSETLNEAVKIAMDHISGYIIWDKIKVES